MKFIKILTLALLMGAIGNVALAQVSAGDKAKAEESLKDAGVTEEQINSKLAEKGIDVNNIKPEQLPKLEAEIQKAIAEIEAENKAKTAAASDIEEDASKPQPKPKEPEQKQDPIKIPTDESFLPKDYIYGHHLYAQGTIQHIKEVDTRFTPDNYLLGVGDRLAVNIFGLSQADLSYEIEEDGFIRPSGLYKIYVKGLTFGEAKKKLVARFKLIYRFNSDQITVTLDATRMLNINIYGDVKKPGSYNISAFNNVFNAIALAGGPTATGSLREIKIIGVNGEREVDFYKFISPSGLTREAGLENGDVIFLPKISKQISVKGNALRNGEWVYELKADENFNDLLALAGGIVNEQTVNRVVQNTREAQKLVTKSFKLSEAKSGNITLSDGDVITIASASYKGYDYYTVSGPVVNGGTYPHKEGLTMADVLKEVKLKPEAITDIAYVFRKKIDGTSRIERVDLANPELIKIDPLDYVSFYESSRFVDSFNISISGAVRDPQTFTVQRDKSYTVYDAIFLARGLKQSATDFGFITNTNLKNANNISYKVVNVREAFENPSSLANILLEANDKLTIPSIQQYTDSFEISVSGSVRKPGEFKFSEGMSLQQVLTMSGGLEFQAASNRVEVYRLNIEENEATSTLAYTLTVDRNVDPLNMNADFLLRPFDAIIVRDAPEFEPIRYVTIKGAVKYPGKYAILKRNEKISDVLARANGITDEAFPEAATITRNSQGERSQVVTRVDKALMGRKKFDIFLKPDDIITIPKCIDVININRIGTNVLTEKELVEKELDSTLTDLSVVISSKSKRAKWYVNTYAGGFSKDAKRGKTAVTYPNGQVKRTRTYGLFRIYPKVRRGSSIRLTLKEKNSYRDEKQDVDKSARRRERIDRIIDTTTALLSLTVSAVTTIVLVENVK